jgi:ferredoxin
LCVVVPDFAAGFTQQWCWEHWCEEDAMRVEVDPNICEGHGQCNAVAPEVYDLDEGGYCLIRNPELPAELEAQAEEGARACPVQAIKIIR